MVTIFLFAFSINKWYKNINFQLIILDFFLFLLSIFQFSIPALLSSVTVCIHILVLLCLGELSFLLLWFLVLCLFSEAYIIIQSCYQGGRRLIEETPSETNIRAEVPYIKWHRPINIANPPISGFCICGFNLCVPAKSLVMSNSVQHYGL